MSWLVVIALLLWIYILYTLKRADMGFWHYLVGSVGLFTFFMILVEPYAVVFMQKAVAAACGVLGKLTGLYEIYFQYGILFIQSGTESLSLYIDFECSGVIEIMAFLALLWFFQVYEVHEKVVVSIAGSLAIFVSNVLRIFLICLLIRIFGKDIYFLAHTVIGRIFFYACSVLLYFYVFTKPQIIRQKVGAFHYERN
jgi:exosortase family protein XrtG